MDELQDARQLWSQLQEVFGDERLWEPMSRLKAVLMYAEGKSLAEVSRAVGRNQSTVRGWIRDFEREGLRGLYPLGVAKRSSQIFANLLVARLAEDFFIELIGPKLRTFGLTYQDRRSEYTETDFSVMDRGGREVFLVNVKVHSSKFEQANRFVNLDPEDTFPLALYKILMGFKYQKDTGLPFLFVVSIMWGIVEQVVGLIQPEDREIVELVFQTRTRGKKRAEDRLVDSLVDKLRKSSKWATLLSLLQHKGQHRVLSAQKGLSIFMDRFEERCPALTIGQFTSKFGGRKGLPAEINMHFSISSEMAPLDRLLDVLTDEGVQGLIDAVRTGEI